MARLSPHSALVVFSILILAGCHSKSAGSSETEGRSPATAPASPSDGQVVTGRVVSEPPPPGRLAVERWRFVPDDRPGTYLRLTRAEMQEAISPEAKEIRLDPWAGKRVRVTYQRRDSNWVWGAEVAEQR